MQTLQKDLQTLQKDMQTLQKDRQTLQKDRQLFQMQIRAIAHVYYPMHIRNFFYYCVSILIDLTMERRVRQGRPDMPFQAWVKTLTDEIHISVGGEDVLGPRLVTVPIQALLSMQQVLQVIREEGISSANSLVKSSVQDIAVSIQYLDEAYRNTYRLTEYEMHLLFEVVFGISIDACLESTDSKWGVHFNTPIRRPQQVRSRSRRGRRG